MKLKIKFTINLAAPWLWAKRKVLITYAFGRAALRETLHYTEHAWWSVDENDKNRILWIGTTKDSGHVAPVRATVTYFGEFEKET